MKRFILALLFALVPAFAQTITSFSPAVGPVATAVTITGWGFTGVSAVTFNTTPAAFTVVDDNTITTAVPLGASTGFVLVDTATSDPVVFTVTTPMPRITSFSPASGFEGTNVTIVGIGLSIATGVTFNGSAASFVVLNVSSLRAVVPIGATTGPISVTTPLGTATTGRIKFTVH